MPSAEALAQIARAAARNAGLRPLTADEAQLIAEAIDAGAILRSDSAYEAFVAGEGGLPVSWSCYVHCEDVGIPAFEEAAAKQVAIRDAFHQRMLSGDLKPLAYRVVAQRAAHVAKAAA